MSRKDSSEKLFDLRSKILSTNQIAVFFDNQNLLKESIDPLDFWHKDNR